MNMNSSTEKSTTNKPAHEQKYLNSNNQPYFVHAAYSDEQRYSPQDFAGAQLVINTSACAPTQPAASYNPRYPPQQVPRAEGCFERSQKNSPQCSSVGSASMLLISGGMHWAWSCTFYPPMPFIVTRHMQICWFLAAIIGAIFSAVASRRIHTKLIYLCSSILVTIGGILFLSQSNTAAAITAARYLDGIGVGMALVQMLVLAGEEIVKELRGTVSSILVSMFFTLGILVDIIYATIYSYYGYEHYAFSGTQIHGVLSTFCGVVSLLMSGLLVIESPVYYLLRNQEDEALHCLRRLQRPFVVSFESYELLEELKRYVADNKQNGGSGLLALFKLCLYEGLISLSFSSVVISGLVVSTVIYIDHAVYWPYIVFGVLRWLGAFIAGTTMDCLGRKKLMIIGCIVCGGLAIGIGSVYANAFNIFKVSVMATVMFLIFVLQFFSGFFMSSAPVYSTEAFPLAFKPYFIAIGFIVQMLIQFIISVSSLSVEGLSAYFITMGVLYVVFFFFSLFTLPETKGDTLRVAQEKFRSCSYKQIQW